MRHCGTTATTFTNNEVPRIHPACTVKFLPCFPGLEHFFLFSFAVLISMRGNLDCVCYLLVSCMCVKVVVVVLEEFLLSLLFVSWSFVKSLGVVSLQCRWIVVRQALFFSGKVELTVRRCLGPARQKEQKGNYCLRTFSQRVMFAITSVGIVSLKILRPQGGIFLFVKVRRRDGSKFVIIHRRHQFELFSGIAGVWRF